MGTYVAVKLLHNRVGMALLAILLIVILVVLIRRLLKKPFGKTGRWASLIGLTVTHIQFLIGLILYFLSPLGIMHASPELFQNKIGRFYLLEHPLTMLIGVVLITIGNHASKNKNFSDAGKYNRVLLYFAIGFILIVARIPWFLWF